MHMDHEIRRQGIVTEHSVVGDNVIEHGKREMFEVRSYQDDAWYDATVEVRRRKIKISFEGFGEEEDETWDVDYLRRNLKTLQKYIRLQSVQLQDHNCGSVVKNMMVCARHVQVTETGEEELKFFDAKITKDFHCTADAIFFLKSDSRRCFFFHGGSQVARNNHDVCGGEEICRCVFQVEWMSGPETRISKATAASHSHYLDCADICLINPRNRRLKSHPVIKALTRLATDPDKSSPLPKKHKVGCKIGSISGCYPVSKPMRGSLSLTKVKSPPWFTPAEEK